MRTIRSLGRGFFFGLRAVKNKLEGVSRNPGKEEGKKGERGGERGGRRMEEEGGGWRRGVRPCGKKNHDGRVEKVKQESKRKKWVFTRMEMLGLCVMR